MPIIELKGQSIDYVVRTSKRAKRISVRYSIRDGLEVVYPPGLRQPTPETLLRERSDWILAAVDRFSEARAKLPRRAYQDGETFLFRGAGYRLLRNTAPAGCRISVKLADGCLAVSLPGSGPDAEIACIRAAVQQFYRKQAQCYLPARASELAETHGFKFEKLRIKNQKTRWGSCSSKRNINLNLRLMMAPDGAIDYVILHELCHLRELNHTPAFWALVETYCPDFRGWKDWFRQHGPSLIL